MRMAAILAQTERKRQDSPVAALKNIAATPEHGGRGRYPICSSSTLGRRGCSGRKMLVQQLVSGDLHVSRKRHLGNVGLGPEKQ